MQPRALMLSSFLFLLKLWDEAWITEPVRITPAGKPERPFLFEKSVAVSLDAPHLEDAAIHYTLDGSEPKPLRSR